MKLDLKKFKKIDFDGKQTLLEHDDGHHLKIAHKGLSKEYRQELDKMPVHKAKGGFAKWSQKYDPNFKKVTGAKASQPSQPSKPQDPSAYTEPKQAKHSYTEPDNQNSGAPFDEDIVVKALNRKAPPFGPMGAEKPMYPPCINPSCKSYGRSHPNCRCYGGNEHVNAKFANGGEVESYCSKDRKHQQGCEYYAFGTPDPIGTYQEAVPQETPSPDMVSQQQSVPEEITGSEPMGSNFQMAPSATPETLSNMETGVAPKKSKSKKTEIPDDLSSPATGEGLPQEMAPAKTPEPTVEDNYNQALQRENDDDAAFNHDLQNGHITPHTYKDLYANKDTLGKVGTIFGLMLGGMGSGLSGQPNMMLHMMDQVLQRDFDAQKQSKENALNFHRVALQGLLAKANAGLINANAAQIWQDTGYKRTLQTTFHDLVNKINKLPDGPLKAQGQNMLGMLGMAMQDKIMNMNDAAAAQEAKYKMFYGPQQEGGASGPDAIEQQFKNQINYLNSSGPEGQRRAQDLMERHIPGTNTLADRAIPENKRNELQAMNVLDEKAKQLISYAKAHKGTLSPNERAVADQMANELVGFYSQSLDNGVMTSGRLGWLDDQVKHRNPTSIFQDALGGSARLKEIMRSNSLRRGLVYKSLGLPRETGTSQGTPDHKTAQDWLKDNPNHPKAKQVRKILGT